MVENISHDISVSRVAGIIPNLTHIHHHVSAIVNIIFHSLSSSDQDPIAFRRLYITATAAAADPADAGKHSSHGRRKTLISTRTHPMQPIHVPVYCAEVSKVRTAVEFANRTLINNSAPARSFLSTPIIRPCE